MEYLQNVLFALSNAFLLPVLAGVLASFLYATYLIGQFLSETLDRRSNRRHLAKLYAGTPTVDHFLALPWRLELGRFQQAIQEFRHEPAFLDKRVVDIENQMQRRVERLGIMSRLGPILGLVGTLIPLQPALAGLARGEMQTMGANLLIGFTTTVVGLLVGGTCYAISVVVRNWQQQDVTDMQFLMEQWALAAESPGERSDYDVASPQSIAAAAAFGRSRLEG